MSHKPTMNLESLLFYFLLGFAISVFMHFPAFAGNPHSAYYSSDNDKVFWFIATSDIHIGKKGDLGRENLTWLVTEARNVINPSFIIVGGDLTDSTNGSALGLPDGPYQEEWDAYRTIVDTNGMNPAFYFDIPGNHDHYNDATFAYYRNNSVQGRATGQTQVSWTSSFSFGTYHFVGISTPGNDGASFNMDPFDNFGDHAGLDTQELQFIEKALEDNKSAELSLVFGHHPLKTRLWPPENLTQTALTYGEEDFLGLMDRYAVPVYTYGHTHFYREEFFLEGLTEGVFYFNLAALGESEKNQYALVAIDCNGISVTPQNVRTWPVVHITAPLDKNLGIENTPYKYSTSQTTSNPVRALVFDINPVTKVEYRIDRTGEWFPMNPVATNSALWEASSATNLWDETHTIEVRATGSTTRTDSIPTANPTGDVSSDKSCFISSSASATPFRHPEHFLGLIFALIFVIAAGNLYRLKKSALRK